MEADPRLRTRARASFVAAARRASTRARSRRESSTRRAVCFSSAASRAQASTKSPRPPQPASRRSTPDFPGKQALFTAVIERLVQPNTSLEAFACAGGSIEERLDALAAVLLTRLLSPETIGLIRVAVAEARRFPDLATSVSCMGRDRPTEAVARVFDEIGRGPTTSGRRPPSRRKSSRRRRAGFSTWWCCRCW